MNQIVFLRLLSSLVPLFLISCGESQHLIPPKQSIVTPYPSVQTATVRNANEILGLWRGHLVSNTIKFTFELEVEENRIAQHVTCRFSDGSELKASVWVAATIGLTGIVVLEDKIETKTKEGKTCGVSLYPKNIPYRFENGVLVVTGLNEGRTDKMQRVN